MAIACLHRVAVVDFNKFAIAANPSGAANGAVCGSKNGCTHRTWNINALVITACAACGGVTIAEPAGEFHRLDRVDRRNGNDDLINGAVDTTPAVVQRTKFRIRNAQSGLVRLQIFG